jgi:hypothetical protein
MDNRQFRLVFANIGNGRSDEIGDLVRVADVHRRAGPNNFDGLNINPDALLSATKNFLKRFSNFPLAHNNDN